MIAVSNTSPLVFLTKIKKTHILCKLFSEVLIPAAVWSELMIKQEEVFLPSCAKRISVQKAMKLGLGAGETEAIELARKRKADFILLDDRQARKAAVIFGLKPIGTLGILLKSLEKQLMKYSEFRMSLDALVESNCHMSVELYNFILKEAEKYSHP